MKATEKSYKEMAEKFDAQIKNLELLKVNYLSGLNEFVDMKKHLILALNKMNLIIDEDHVDISKTGDYHTWNEGDYFHVSLRATPTDKFKFLKTDRYYKNSNVLSKKARKLEMQLTDNIYCLMAKTITFNINQYSLGVEESGERNKSILIYLWIK